MFAKFAKREQPSLASVGRSRPLAGPIAGLVLCAAASVWAGLVGQSVAAADSSQRPNIILLFSDDAGYADFGFMEQYTGRKPEIQTPNIDKLARRSLQFTNGYVTHAYCGPSRAGMMTGLYQQRFGHENNNGRFTEDDPRMMTERMRELGYKTGVIGKWHLGRSPGGVPQDRGIDIFWGLHGGSRNYFGKRGKFLVRDETGKERPNWTTEPSFNKIDPDPNKGRYLTDAFGDEASRFVSVSANQKTPFFLYVPFTAPHSPPDAKSQDLAKYDDSDKYPELTQKKKYKIVAAQTLALDRAIGEILDRVYDPNGDGDKSDSIADNTLIVFTNDNGGRQPDSQTYTDNTPLRGYKGDAWEGGVRVPFLISMPDPKNRGKFFTGTRHEAISTLDLFSTFVAASGGEMTDATDGVNLIPYLQGRVHRVSRAPDKPLVWRKSEIPTWAIRQDEWNNDKKTVWKLVRGKREGKPSPIQLFQIQANGTGEDNRDDLAATNPEKFAQLLRDFTAWEVKMRKPDRSKTPGDQFTLKGNETEYKWSEEEIWKEATDNKRPPRMVPNDSYANTILEFGTRNAHSYTATNDLTRISGLAYMLNQMRLTGDFTGNSNQQAKINGEAKEIGGGRKEANLKALLGSYEDLLIAKNLSGIGPKITLDATDNSASADFTFSVDNNLVLYDNLTITGDGTAKFRITGDIRDYHNARRVTKQGASKVTLEGENNYLGQTKVEEGTFALAGSLAQANLLVDGGLFEGDGTVRFRINGAKSDLIQLMSGTLDISQLTLHFDALNLTELSYLIVDFSGGGTLLGSEFLQVQNLPAGYRLQVLGKQIRLTAVPDPTR